MTVSILARAVVNVSILALAVMNVSVPAYAVKNVSIWSLACILVNVSILVKKPLQVYRNQTCFYSFVLMHHYNKIILKRSNHLLKKRSLKHWPRWKKHWDNKNNRQVKRTGSEKCKCINFDSNLNWYFCADI